MRRNLMLALALAGVLSLGVAAIASAVQTTLRAGNLIVTFGGTTSPKAMPKNDFMPVTTNIFGKISTSDGTHPSALREVDLRHRQGRENQRQRLPVLQSGRADGARHQSRDESLRRVHAR